MSAFSAGKITEAGRVLLSKTLAGPGSGIIFTRMEIADNSGNSHSMNINRVLHKDCLVVESTVYSNDMDKDLWVINLNLYAKAMTNDKEILFMSANDENPDYIPNDDSMCVGVTYTMQVAINNADNITFERTENAIVTMDMLNDILIAKDLPVKFAQNNDGDIIIEENPVKIGIPGYVSSGGENG